MKPDFVVAGAPKCGTTAMHHYLRAVPGVFVPEEKEPNFFSSDVPIRKRKSLDEYLELFSPAPDGARVGEVSVWYLYSERAATAIRELCGDIQIIAMLRNPIDAMHSLHAQLLWAGDEDIEDFAAALEAEGDRVAGRRAPPRGTKGTECLCYRRVYSYSEQVRRFQETFGAANVHALLFEDWARDTAASFADALRFLDIAPPAGSAFPRINPSKAVRSQRLRNLHRDRVPRLRRWVRRWIPSSAARQLVGRPLMRALRGLYTRHEPRAPLPTALRRRLAHELAPDVERLRSLLGRELDEWTDFRAA